MAEEWRPVAGYEGLYEVSDLGRVRSLDRFDSTGRFRRGQLLKPQPVGVKRDHFDVILSRDGVRHAVKLHRLVAETFIPNPEGHPYVLHWDDDGRNNAATNLRWGSNTMNIADSFRTGRRVRRGSFSAPVARASMPASIVATHPGVCRPGAPIHGCPGCRYLMRERARARRRDQLKKEAHHGR